MKKQFFRVKQLADQTFNKAGKTELLSEDLEGAERRIEYIKTTCQNTGKKLSGCLLVSGQDKQKKSAEHQLGVTMLECSSVCDEDSLLRYILQRSGDTVQELAGEIAERDQQIEQFVVSDLQKLSENDIPNIFKQKKNLAKLILDMDSARTRYQQAQNQAQKHTNNSASTKIDSIKDEFEECELKVEQCRDSLACDMFQLIAKEADVCLNILQYCKLQRAYHESALRTLEKVVPELETRINTCSRKTVYGFSLEEHLRISERKIAFPIELCVCALLTLGVEEEGLFRVTGSTSKIKRMKLSIDAWCMTLETAINYKDVHVIAGALKSYLRELPEPLLTSQLYQDWLSVVRMQGNIDAKKEALKLVLKKLPQANYDNLRYLVKFFSYLSKYQEFNKMSPQNIAIVIAPSLMWVKDDTAGMSNLYMNSANLCSTVVDILLSSAEYFFPGEEEFFVTIHRSQGSESDAEEYGFKRSHVRNHSGGDFIDNTPEIKRSQSNNSLSEEPTQCSPKPVTRRKNKSAAPVPPNSTPTTKKQDRPDKPPRPINNVNNNNINATLPRPKKETKSTETSEDLMSQSVGPIGFEAFLTPESKLEYVANSIENLNVLTAKLQKNTEKIEKQKTNVATNTDQIIPMPVAAPRTTIQTTEPVAKDQNENIENRQSPKQTDKGDVESPVVEAKEVLKPDMISVKKEWLLGKEAQDENARSKPLIPERPSTLKPTSFKIKNDNRNNYENVSVSSNENLSGNSSSDEKLTLQKAQMYCIDKKQVAIVQYDNNEKKRRNSGGSRPASMPGDKPERPPKPDFISPSSSSHTRTFSDGQVVDKSITNHIVHHPTTSPPPVPAKPKIVDYTDM